MTAKWISAIGLVSVAVGVGIWMAFGFGADPKLNEKPAPAPEFTEVTEWLNSKPLKLADQKEKVVVVHFWTNGCINCVNNYPHYKAWQKKYKDEANLLIVGIHTPEFDSEKDVERIKTRAAKNELKFPIAVDNDGKNWKAWGNEYWPCIYLVDKSGNIRQKWVGELGEKGYMKMTEQIDSLRVEKGDQR